MLGRSRGVGALCVAVLAANVVAARADGPPAGAASPPPDDAELLVARGEELGRQGEWTQAVASFKHADALTQRTKHPCMIALAYTRRELWAQAELFFRRCHERAQAADPLPDWVGDAEQQLATKIAGANIPAITIVVTPATRVAIAISGFEPDEVLAPGAIHLPPGHYTIQATAPGYFKASRELDVAAGTPQELAFRLMPLTKPNLARDSKLPWFVVGAGGALVAAGVLVDLVKVQPLRDEMAKSRFAYGAHAGELSTWRTATIGLWAAGAVAIGVGTWLEKRRRGLPMVIPASEHGGASLSLGWSR